jgi:cob(I)alamin adenosyltransferase
MSENPQSQLEGQIHAYTGDGKGKTTSAVGLTVRAAGAGLKVAFIQFDKGSEAEDFYSERKILRTLPEVEVLPTGKIRMMPNGQFRFSNSPPDFAEAKRGLDLAITAVSSHKFTLVICDEILSCLLTTLLKEEDVLRLISVFEKSGRDCDLVLTGRTLPETIKEKADLVSEVKMVKHYFNKGLPARRGIEY